MVGLLKGIDARIYANPQYAWNTKWVNWWKTETQVKSQIFKNTKTVVRNYLRNRKK